MIRIGYVDPVPDDPKQWMCVYYQDDTYIGRRLFKSAEEANRFLYEEWMDVNPVSN